MMNARPIQAIINLEAMRHNVAIIKKLAGTSRVFGVVKADGYGHGLSRIYSALSHIDGFAVIEMDAAAYLRAQDARRPILLLEGVFSLQELSCAADLKLDLVVHNIEQIALLEKCRSLHSFHVFLKINTGMNRLGIKADQAIQCHEALCRLPVVERVTAMTHYAEADGPRGLGWQNIQFAQAIGSLDIPVSKSNSAALFRFGANEESWVRPGIVLYGASPMTDVPASSLGLKPVMTLKSGIIGVQEISAGDRVGYGGTYVANRKMKIGIVAGGYGDGYPRSMPNGSPVIVNDIRTTTVGRVSMDTFAVDLTDVPAAGVGSTVVLWGEGLPVDEVAQQIGTIGYELLTRVTTRVPFVVCSD
ncbi:MAG: alanine racemase [Proteobacteria bacterium]|nr:alanine racemase [Pseudomonadota bacterium]